MKQSWTARYGGKCLLDSWADMTSPRFGGPWTERKLQILQAYLDSYTTALKNQPFALTYVDGFAGAGSYRESGADYDEFDEFRQGSTRIALAIDDKPFDRFVFIEKEVGAAEALLTLASEFQGRQIEVVQGDANIGVPQFCHNMSDFDRAVVFLDPYATEVSWETVKAIAESGKIDCWILFPLMAVTRLMPTQKEPDEAWAKRLGRIFGERNHWQQSYHDSPQLSLFESDQRRQRSEGTEQIANRYRERLRTVFHSVAPTRCTLKNSKETPLFELFFAVSNPTGAEPAMRIANHILKDW